jgi:hypothetical protein
VQSPCTQQQLAIKRSAAGKTLTDRELAQAVALEHTVRSRCRAERRKRGWAAGLADNSLAFITASLATHDRQRPLPDCSSHDHPLVVLADASADGCRADRVARQVRERAPTTATDFVAARSASVRPFSACLPAWPLTYSKTGDTNTTTTAAPITQLPNPSSLRPPMAC